MESLGKMLEGIFPVTGLESLGHQQIWLFRGTFPQALPHDDFNSAEDADAFRAASIWHKGGPVGLYGGKTVVECSISDFRCRFF